MRLAVVSDIHSNGDALQAVAREIDRRRIDRVVHLGDLVGYNAEPEACVRWAREYAAEGVVGNHDAVVCGKSNGEFFHLPALRAARWSAENISSESMAYLAGLPESVRLPEGILLVHGAPSDPDRYLFLLEDAEEEMEMLSVVSPAQAVFFGHTHLPMAFVRRIGGITVSAPLEGLRIEEGETAMLNPGSVGQPRDRNPRASFLVFDTRTGEVSWIRVPYDIGSCRRKVLDAGLPRFFAARLADGT
ncbi:MAG TPA: metallophosphoesterase family protein [Candidatus Deferrimicrobiaceae bacterium]|nr:metallophosphoesterase family protein [Candidatus Deferrimicrobiaceae bacterium]